MSVNTKVIKHAIYDTLRLRFSFFWLVTLLFKYIF